jgi:hypothetical protein
LLLLRLLFDRQWQNIQHATKADSLTHRLSGKTVKIRQENTMNTTYVLRQSDTLVFNIDSETFTFTARRLADVKRRAFRKQFHEDSNLRLEDENGNVISIKRSGFKWEDKQ